MTIVKTYIILFSMSLISFALNSPGTSIGQFQSNINNANAICASVNKEAGYLISICPVQV